ncbi:two-component system, chemotaxis family, CheB/CheR fusion protein [Rhodovulum sp. ES.010]|uniref:chemotaxis protein CheB n=1 Tax=Rhodovulum sp. ES.010 TaxID=1882821 RepID=UPI00092B7403|nr:chemotaxis protein CheB [Rhodovulum sp. ES.010]SIO24204.1 two-component system, chemotaxis family, CheB/CheR fusion protein [Rhodovulum sp. ES.010]
MSSAADAGTTGVAPSGQVIKSVIGIGASAGGLSALESFFENCPSDSGAVFVVIQHLSPTHESLMADLLSRRCAMPVRMIETDTPVEPDHVYLIPPNAVMRIEDDMLRLEPRHEGLSLPIDVFFESLARSYGEQAVGIVLSGTGADGTRGAIAINAAGGLVLIQDPADARFDGMPASVRGTGVADAVLPVGELAPKAIELQDRSRIVDLPRDVDIAPPTPEEPSEKATGPSTLNHIFELVREATGIDFRLYKSSTVMRRLGRRMQVLGVRDLPAYLAVIQNSPDEVAALHRELLISVTRFFRDSKPFEELEGSVIPAIIDSLDHHDTLRAWVAGCSTGEEAYSIAMLLHEGLHRAGRHQPIKIFATDVSQQNLEIAAAGVYPASIRTEVSPERIERFFLCEGESLKVSGALRQSIVFARHDLLTNPPFTRMHLVSCRNTLIYLRRRGQETALRRLKYAVQKGGYLFLGTSETMSGDQRGFHVCDGKNKIFRRVAEGYPDAGSMTVPITQSDDRVARSRREKSSLDASLAGSTGRPAAPAPNPEKDLFDAAVQSLLEAWAPPSILLDDKQNVLHFIGNVGAVLRTQPGRASLDLSRLLPQPIASVASVLVQKAIDAQQAFESDPIQVDDGEKASTLHLHAMPIRSPAQPTCVVLSFHTDDGAGMEGPHPERMDLATVAKTRIDILEADLNATRADLQATIEALETSNEELQATNEELMASNEELQSSNEELQSVNEEVNTVNAEFQEKMEQLNRANADLSSMIRAVGVATVFLDETLLIRRFSPDATRIFNLREGDIGRPLGDISHKLRYPDLLDNIRETIQSGTLLEREIAAGDSELFRLRISPYAVSGTTHRGVVLTLTDVTVHRTLKRLQSVIDALPEHVAVLHFDGTIAMANSAWNRFAAANGDPGLQTCGVGANYFEACEVGLSLPNGDEDSEDSRIATCVRRGLGEVLSGARSRFAIEYPCHTPDEERWFYMTAAPVSGSEFAAVVSHINITSWYRKIEAQFSGDMEGKSPSPD